jgi:hypothetical protein
MKGISFRKGRGRKSPSRVARLLLEQLETRESPTDLFGILAGFGLASGPSEFRPELSHESDKLSLPDAEAWRDLAVVSGNYAPPMWGTHMKPAAPLAEAWPLLQTIPDHPFEGRQFFNVLTNNPAPLAFPMKAASHECDILHSIRPWPRFGSGPRLHGAGDDYLELRRLPAPGTMPTFPDYNVIALKRWPAGTSYREIIDTLKNFLRTEPLQKAHPTLVLDDMGVRPFGCEHGHRRHGPRQRRGPLVRRHDHPRPRSPARSQLTVACTQKDFGGGLASLDAVATAPHLGWPSGGTNAD